MNGFTVCVCVCVCDLRYLFKEQIYLANVRAMVSYLQGSFVGVDDRALPASL